MKGLVLKIISISLLVSGSALLIYSSYLLITINMNEEKALSKAQTVISELEEKNQLHSPASQYSFNPGDIIGILQISKLNKEMPIIEGTDESELERGVGHYSTTKLPNQQDRIFLAGHRDTVFKKMGTLQNGDKLTIKMKAGTHTYEIYETLIVKETDLSVLKSTAPQEVLTLSTCYPFEYLSSTTERYIINARRIE
ncbi:class D sortase [Rossellomorea sp. LJF3]|uniref:class D sortase n=1 Tax=Rossellomorea sp. LJF3 TaxID=3126099 RepID=UPI00300C381C